MNRILCHSKIHRATVTEAHLHYQGSMTIDAVLLKAANIKPFEQIHVVNINNGLRYETYAIEGQENSGIICADGAAARLTVPGDVVIILAYGIFTENELETFKPTFVFVNDQNKMIPKHH